MRAAGLDVRVDAAGNILGRRAGSDPSRKPLLFGSHIDSVPDGGNYDGDVGSLSAIEVAQTLGERGVALRHPIEVVVFQNEEGGTVGSRAMAGQLEPAALTLTARSGKVTRDGIAFIGGDPDRLESRRAQARRHRRLRGAAHRAGRDARREEDRHRRRPGHRRHRLVGRHGRRLREPRRHDADGQAAGRAARDRALHRDGQPRCHERGRDGRSGRSGAFRRCRARPT